MFLHMYVHVLKSRMNCKIIVAKHDCAAQHRIAEKAVEYLIKNTYFKRIFFMFSYVTNLITMINKYAQIYK